MNHLILSFNSDTPVIVKFEGGIVPDCRAMDLSIDPIVEQYNDSNGILLIVMNWRDCSC